GAGPWHLVGAHACLPRGRRSGAATGYRRTEARRLALRLRPPAAAAARRRRADDGQRQPGPQPAHLRLGTAWRGTLRLGAAIRSHRAGTDERRRLRAPGRLRDPRPRRDAVRADAGPLPAAALRACPTAGRLADLLSGRGLRRRLDLHAGGADRLTRP